MRISRIVDKNFEKKKSHFFHFSQSNLKNDENMNFLTFEKKFFSSKKKLKRQYFEVSFCLFFIHLFQSYIILSLKTIIFWNSFATPGVKVIRNCRFREISKFENRWRVQLFNSLVKNCCFLEIFKIFHEF